MEVWQDYVAGAVQTRGQPHLLSEGICRPSTVGPPNAKMSITRCRASASPDWHIEAMQSSCE